MASLQERWKEDLGEEVYYPICLSCAHYDGDLGCAAFPEGIPLGVFTGDFDHTKPLEGDNGIQYKQRAVKTDLVRMFKENPYHYPAGTAGSKGGQFMPKPGSTLPDGTKVGPDAFRGGKFKQYAEEANNENLDNKAQQELVKEVLSPDEAAEFFATNAKIQARVDSGQESYKLHGRFSPDGKKWLGYTRERVRNVHDSIFNEEMDRITAAIPEDGKPALVMLGGRGGSGKSSFGVDGKINQVYTKDGSYYVVDPDELKQKIWERERPGVPFDPQEAAIYHEESGHLADELIRMARHAGANVVVDITMKSPKDQFIYDFAQSGYEQIEAHFMHTTRREAIRRTLKRWKDGTRTSKRNRIVPPHVVASNVNNEKNFDRILTNKYLKAWSFYDGNGASPVRVDGSGETSIEKRKKAKG